MRYRDKWPEYAQQCDTMAIKPEREAEFTQCAKYAIANKDIYTKIETVTGVHWYHVAVIHKRESDAQDKNGNPLFTSYLGNGQSLSRVTTIVPIGRGPFTGPNAFINGAIDALHIDGLDKVVPPWPLEKILYWAEVFNGSGYSSMGLPSPYIWGGTTIQRIGKYVADHVFDPHVWDSQLGCAGILYQIAKFDTSVRFSRET